MSAKYWQRGETIDYTATEAVSNGDVVDLATRIGVAGNDIAANETGAVHVVGVFEIPKATGEITLGGGCVLGQVRQKYHDHLRKQHPRRLGRGRSEKRRRHRAGETAGLKRRAAK